jgi:isopentenyl diphosphate isomerase/L-lactate dehydrogenase-like FMN-dependent dehydrogenase
MRNPRRLAEAASIADLRRIARRRIPRAVFDFIDGGAEEEITLAKNTRDLQDIALIPRYLCDVSNRDLGTSILGRAAALPLIVAPTGLAALAWPRADIAIARAAARHSIPFIISTSSSIRMEDIVASAPKARAWFQIYIYKDRKLVESLLHRAATAGIEAIVLTIDTPVLGNRERDTRNRFTVPLRPNARLAWDLVRCFPWSAATIRRGTPRMQNFVDYGHGKDVTSLAQLMTSNMDASVTWHDLAWLRDQWPGKLVLKGVISPEDADLAVRHGVDAIIVSNHGGRQLDSAPSTVSMLPEIVARTADRCEILFDGGIRRGSDIAKVVALGARAAMVGRPLLYGAAAGGDEGPTRALDLLRSEYDRCLALLGRASTAALRADAVRLGQTTRFGGERP